MDQYLDNATLSEVAKSHNRKIQQAAANSTIGGICLALKSDGPTDASLFSSSLPVFPREKSSFQESKLVNQSMKDANTTKDNVNDNLTDVDFVEDIEQHLIGNLLPDDEDVLLSGINDDFFSPKLPNQAEELEDYDVFGYGGGMELDCSPMDSINAGMAKASITDSCMINGLNLYGISNGVGTVSGEHPLGEHPSRTLFVRNINTNVEDTELRALFEPFGEIRSLYTATKSRGFVMISYYDIRSARAAMKMLQSKPLRRRKLDIHFSIPKDNPSEKDLNQGTLVIFNLDPSVTNDEIRRIFGVHGEIKEIRETPQKQHHKFIEFYDVRDAEAALRYLNKSEIAGKRIKIEPSHPGGVRRNLHQQLTYKWEQDESRLHGHYGTPPIIGSPPGLWPQYSSPTENGTMEMFPDTAKAASPVGSTYLTGIPSTYPFNGMATTKLSPIGKDSSRVNYAAKVNLSHGIEIHIPRSFPGHNGSTEIANSLHSSSVGSSLSSAAGVGRLNGPQFLWGSPPAIKVQTQSPAWSSSMIGNPFMPSNCPQGLGILRPSFKSSLHQVGSAPSVFSSDNLSTFYPDSPNSPVTSNMKFTNLGTDSAVGFPVRTCINAPDFKNFGPINLRSPYSGPGFIGVEGLVDQGRGSQLDNKRQYQLDLERIKNGEDLRTTLMIKNIPNKYTAKMLLADIDETHRGTYDFFYLPIDFKNKCNVGYAFIDMLSPAHVISFYQAFNGKKWEKFNSEKVVSLAYGRIQGRAALVAHFQNSSLMNEDRHCRPILFDSKAPGFVSQEVLLANGAPNGGFLECSENGRGPEEV